MEEAAEMKGRLSIFPQSFSAGERPCLAVLDYEATSAVMCRTPGGSFLLMNYLPTSRAVKVSYCFPLLVSTCMRQTKAWITCWNLICYTLTLKINLSN